MAKLIGYGSVLSTTSSTGTIEHGQIRSITLPQGSGTDVDTTCLDTAGNFRTFSRGPVDPGTVTLELVYDAALTSHKILGTYYSAGDSRTWTAIHGSSTGVSQAFSAYVSGLSGEIPLDDLIKCEVTLKVSGDPGYATT